MTGRRVNSGTELKPTDGLARARHAAVIAYPIITATITIDSASRPPVVMRNAKPEIAAHP